MIRLCVVSAAVLLACGCSSVGKPDRVIETQVMEMSEVPDVVSARTFAKAAKQILVERASVDIEVPDLARAEEIVLKNLRDAGGRIEQQTRAQHTVFLRMRVAPEHLKPLIGGWSGLGKVLRNEISAEDVTARYADAEARLKNHTALRDRLRELLKSAKEVKDILAVESELNRIQSDIDSLEAVRNTLTEQSRDAELAVTLSVKVPKQKDTLGPLGWVCYGTWWGVRKLFIWSDGE